MKLLIITQAVNTEDPVLGFFVRWIVEFSKHTEHTEVICLKEGKHNLPENVSVHSLGKPASRLQYIFNFYKYIFSLNYDSVFVHMNQEYVILGGLFWKIFGKKIYLWRNHAKGDLFTRVAVLLSNNVFYTSPQSFTARFRKAIQMPVGIDTDFFKSDMAIVKKPNSILFLGRIAPVKKVVEFVEALYELQKLGAEFFATIAGSSLPKDAEYEKLIHKKISEYGLHNRIQFTGSVTQDEALKLYQEHELYVNLTPSGSMDKTIFEAMSCDMTPMVFNHDLEAVLGPNLIITKLDAPKVAQRMALVLAGKDEYNFRNFVTENHGLKKLMDKLEHEL